MTHTTSDISVAAESGNTNQRRLSTGAKLFVILFLALLPLAFVAMLATKQVSRLGDVERNQLIADAIAQSSERLQTALLADQQKLRAMLGQLGDDEAVVVEICSDLPLTIDGRLWPRATYLFKADNLTRPTCLSNNIETKIAAQMMQRVPNKTNEAVQILPDERALIIRQFDDVSGGWAVSFYPAATLLALAEPGTEIPPSSVRLTNGEATLNLTEIPRRLHRRPAYYIAAPSPVLGMEFGINIAHQLPNSAEFLALVLPVITIIVAAFIAWFVANNLLVRPVVALRRNVRAYKPGEQLAALPKMTGSALEIEQLDDSFRNMSRDVADDKEALAQALDQQKLLTREVHHRVKNNVQVIASLIRIHARGAECEEEQKAYAFMQRRVDALAVVQRNHFAEVEENEGISLSTLVNELAASLRSDTPDGTGGYKINGQVSNLAICQDIAVPVAFLITEVVELCIKIDPKAPVSISAHPDKAEEDSAILTIQSTALKDKTALDERLKKGVDRILAGLAKQMQTPLDYDQVDGSYTLRVCRVRPADNLT